MKNISSILVFTVLILAIQVFPQSLKPVPSEKGTRFFFSSLKPDTIKSVAVAGTFNKWEPGMYTMTFDKATKTWSVDVPLANGIEYMYKLVINGQWWITDPNAPDVTEDEWRNGIIIPQRFGAPFVERIFPPKNKRISALPVVTAILKSNNADIDEKSIKIKLDNKDLNFKYDIKKIELKAEIKEEIADGEHKIWLSFSDKNGNVNDGFTSLFFLDRYIREISTPAFFDSAVIYEIFIRKFCDSDGDGIGDFNGLTSRLGYLQDTLGVNTLWLMPWNESTTDHGYNVVDYFSAEKDYGTYDDYTNFIDNCKKRSIKVLMDFVINHTDSTHPYFLDSYNNPQSKFTSWYQFINSSNTDWNHFGIERKMPKLNFESKEVQEHFIHVAKFWMDPNSDGDFSDGIDGFRCDAAKEVPHTFWSRFRREVKKVNKDVLLLGEVWDNAYFLIPFFKEEFDMLFNYPMYYGIESYILQKDIRSLRKRLMEPEELYPAGSQYANFLSNHDNDRPLSKFRGNKNLTKMALAIIFSLPGTPMIYYGDELGYTGLLPPENVRQNFEWSKLSGAMNDTLSLLHYYTDLINMREQHPALWKRHSKKDPSLFVLDTKEKEILCFLRTDGEKAFLFIGNNNSEAISTLNISMKNLPVKLKNSLINYSTVFDGSGYVNDDNKSILVRKNNYLTLKDFLIEKESFKIIELQ